MHSGWNKVWQKQQWIVNLFKLLQSQKIPGRLSVSGIMLSMFFQFKSTFLISWLVSMILEICLEHSKLDSSKSLQLDRWGMVKRTEFEPLEQVSQIGEGNKV